MSWSPGLSFSPAGQLTGQLGQMNLSGSPMSQSPGGFFLPPPNSNFGSSPPGGFTLPPPGTIQGGAPSLLSILQASNRDPTFQGLTAAPSGQSFPASPMQLTTPQQPLSGTRMGTLPKPVFPSTGSVNPLTGRPEPRNTLPPKSLDFSLSDTLQLPSGQFSPPPSFQQSPPSWGPYLGETSSPSAFVPSSAPSCLVPAGVGYVKTAIGYNPRVDLSPYGVNPNRRAFFGNIERISTDNSMFRKVIFTSSKEQLVVMALQPQEDIGIETHPHTDQFFRIEAGTGIVILGDERQGAEEIPFQAGDSFQIPAGTAHNVFATSPVRLYTIYSPPQHPMDTIDITKDDARIREQSF